MRIHQVKKPGLAKGPQPDINIFSSPSFLPILRNIWSVQGAIREAKTVQVIPQKKPIMKRHMKRNITKYIGRLGSSEA